MPILPKRMILSLAAGPLLALPAACGGGEEEDGRSATGEVLEGTISDDMLPLDSVRSQAPRAEPEAVPGQPAGEATAAEPAEGDAAEPAANAAPESEEPAAGTP